MVATSANANGCPYKGLLPYTEEDREYFFGRERDTEVVASNLFIAPLTILYGTSGVGKSSVLQAGVIPHLRENQRVIVLLFNKWQGENFHLALKEQVLQAITESTKKTDQEVLSEVSKAIDAKQVVTLDRLSLDELVTACRTVFRRRILMIFDQFEEYFLYHLPTKGTDGFDAEFARAVNQPESGVNFMISMREEELSKLDRFRPRIPNLLSNLLRLDNLDGEAASNAIKEPLRVYNQRHPADVKNIDEALVTAIIEQVRPHLVQQAASPLLPGGEPAGVQGVADRIETPFLQLVLTNIWEAEKQKHSHVLRLSTFELLGGALEIARTHLDKVMDRLTEPQRATAAAVLRFLVTPMGSKIALDLDSLVSFSNEKEDDVRAVLDRLGFEQEMRILRKVTVRGQPDRYELFHDVLGPAILDWRSRYVQAQQRIQERVQVEKEFSLLRQKRLRQAVVVLTVLLLMTAGATLYAFSQRSEARRQFAEAENQRKEAENQRSQAIAQYNEAQAQRNEASAQQKIAEDALGKAKQSQTDLEEAKRESDRQKELAISAKTTAQSESVRANKQAESAQRFSSIAQFNLKGFDASRLGNTSDSISNFGVALTLSRLQRDPSSEAYALANLADAYAADGAVLPLELLDLFDSYDEADYDDLMETYQVESYLKKLESMLPAKKEELLKAQARAIDAYEKAIAVNTRLTATDPEKDAWITQRIGDVQLTSQIVSSVPTAGESGGKPDLTAVFKSYYDAIDKYRKADLAFEEGILQTRIAFLKSNLDGPSGTDFSSRNPTISAYEQAWSAFHRAGTAAAKLREAATLSRLGQIYKSYRAESPERLKKAIDYYTQAAVIYGSLDMPKKEGESYLASARLNVESSPPDKERAYQGYGKALTAFQALQRSLASGSKQSDQTQDKRNDARKQILSLIGDIGDLYKDDPKPRANPDEFFKGIVAAEGNDYGAKAAMLEVIGHMYDETLNNKATAIDFYSMENEAWQKVGDSLAQARVLLTIGRLYNGLKDNTSARSKFEEVRKIYQTTTINDAVRDQVASNLISIGKIYTDWTDLKSAFETYEQAFHLYKGAPDNYRIPTIVQSAAELVSENDAPSFFKEVTEFYHNHKDTEGEAFALEKAGDR